MNQLMSGRDYYMKWGDRFDSLDELEGLVMQMDVAEEVPLYYDTQDVSSLQDVDEFKGIYNRGTQKLANIVTDKYALIQHRDAFITLVSALRRAEVDVVGTVKNNRDNVAIEMTFDGILVDDGVEGIELGAKIVNSYNSTSSFRGWGWGLRKVCSNGLYMRSAVPEMSFSIVHRGKAPEISMDAIVSMVDEVRSRVVNYEDAIVVAKEQSMYFPTVDSLAATIQPIIGSERATATAINGYWDGQFDTNRWDVYNLMTAYASHEELSEIRFHNVQRSAERFMAAKEVTIIIPEDAPAFEDSDV